ncbi:MAG: rod shape-determining protein MreC [Hyphomicrobiaceae bacterium]
MSVLRADPFARAESGPRSLHQTVRGGVSLFALMFLSLSLIVMSRLNHEWVQEMRGQAVEAMLPALETVSAPAIRLQKVRGKVGGYVKIMSELERLEEENEQLRHRAARARELEREIARYRELLNSKDTRNFEFVTGRVVADGRGPFARSAILNIGRNHGIDNGYPVVNGAGLIGRTLNAGETASRVLLLTDLNSRVPILFGEDRVRGVLRGNNDPAPEIGFVPQTARPKTGDEVYTSGHGGLFPPGLRIGRIEKLTPRPSVKLYADARTVDFVSVLLVDRPKLENAPDPRISRGSTRLPGQKSVALPTRPKAFLKRAARHRKTIRARQPQ